MIIMEPTVILGAYLLHVLWQFILTYWDYYINWYIRYDFKDSYDQWLKWNFDIVLVGVWEKKTRPFVTCVNNRVIIIDFSSPLRPHSELIHTRDYPLLTTGNGFPEKQLESNTMTIELTPSVHILIRINATNVLVCGMFCKV